MVWADFYRRGPLATDAWWTVVYLANWRFISSASYFSNDGTSSPLLHMWSLAVEEQFYLFWPLVVAAVATLVGRHHGGGRAVRVARLVSLVVVVASAVALWARYDPSAPERAYMGTDTKAFEPMLGALLALTVHERGVATAVRRLALPLSAVGAIVMVALFTRLDGPAPLYFHGGALLFSIAAGLVIIACAADPHTPLARLLSLSPVSYLGRISYGIYLWHWPYAVWLGTDHTTFSWWRATLVVILTVATASASYHFLEMPVRRGRVADWLTPRRTLAAATALVVAFGVWTTVAGGTPLSPLLVSASATHPDRKTVLVVGDSVPLRLAPALAPAAKAIGVRLASSSAGGCSPLSVNQKISPDDVLGKACVDVAAKQVEAMRADNPGIVLWWSRYEIADRYQGPTLLKAGTPAFWAAQRASFASAVQRLTSNGAILVVVLTEPPGIGMKSRCSPTKCHPFLQRMVTDDSLRTTWNAYLTAQAATDPRIRVVRIDDAFCHHTPVPDPKVWGSSLCDDTVNGHPARPDGSHFSLPLVGTKVADTLVTRMMAAALG